MGISFLIFGLSRNGSQDSEHPSVMCKQADKNIKFEDDVDPGGELEL